MFVVEKLNNEVLVSILEVNYYNSKIKCIFPLE
jgi:hypothetical protein